MIFHKYLGNTHGRDVWETAEQLLRNNGTTRITMSWTVVVIKLNSPGVCVQSVEQVGNVSAVVSVECVCPAGMSDS